MDEVLQQSLLKLESFNSSGELNVIMANLGCIDLNPWYDRCDDINRPAF